MNIFILDKDPKIAAQMQVDSHSIKQILESAQMLSTAHRMLDGELYHDLTNNGRKIKRWRLSDESEKHLYKATHVNHPCNIWIRESDQNYKWAYKHWIAMLEEFEYRRGKTHACAKLIPYLIKTPNNIPKTTMTPFALAMPDECKKGDAVYSYRNYYIKFKRHLAEWNWKPERKPEWYV